MNSLPLSLVTLSLASSSLPSPSCHKSYLDPSIYQSLCLHPSIHPSIARCGVRCIRCWPDGRRHQLPEKPIVPSVLLIKTALLCSLNRKPHLAVTTSDSLSSSSSPSLPLNRCLH